MKDLIAKLQLDANCALGAIWMHIDAQAKRIAELEAQLAARPADTDKLLEALAAWESLRSDVLHGVDGLENHQVNTVLDMIDYYAPTASTAGQAPVREVPTWQERWKSEYKMLPPVHSNEACLFMEAEIAELRATLPAASVQTEGE